MKLHIKTETSPTKTDSFTSLDEWLVFLEKLNPDKIELGLNRVQQVFLAMDLKSLQDSTIVEIAGTNGKGSTATLISAVLEKSKISYGLYTSPHLLDFRERIVINGQMVSERSLCEAFSIVKEAATSLNITLTYFEFTTLAALWCFKRANVEVLVLEIGLGGRLDAVNILDANIAVITSIGLDHTKLLGNTLTDIAKEKAGIIKENCNVVMGKVESLVRDCIRNIALSKHATLYEEGYDFDSKVSLDFTYMQGTGSSIVNISYPLPKIPVCCAAVAIKVLHLLRRYNYVITDKCIAEVMPTASLLGRMQRLHFYPSVIADIAHNPQAASHLVEVIRNRLIKGKRYLVVGMLKDKDIESVLDIVKDSFSGFYLCSLGGNRGEKAERLFKAMTSFGKKKQCQVFDSVDKALLKVLSDVKKQDEVIVMGSFVTVASAMRFFAIKNGER